MYCSHTLEHFSRFDGMKVLAGFLHVLKPDGFAEVRVPDLGTILPYASAKKAGLDEVLYRAGNFDVTLHHVLYGHAEEVDRSGNDYWAHKTGFTAQSLREILQKSGFPAVATAAGDAAKNDFDLVAFAFKRQPTAEQIEMMRGMG